MELLVFIVVSMMVIGGAIGVIIYRHPVHAALSLVMTLFGVAVHFVVMEAHFLAAVQVIVYAGAIVVLFLFVIMLLGVDRVEQLRTDALPIQRPLAAVMGVGLIGLLVAAIVSTRGTLPLTVGTGLDVAGSVTGGAPDGVPVDHDGNVRQLAHNLFSDNVFAFELTSVLLIVAVAGTVVMTRREKRRDDTGDSGGANVIAEVAPTPTWYLILAAVLFAIGAMGLLVRRNPLVMFMCIELMLNAVNLSFVAFSTRLGDIGGQTAVFFVLVVAAAEVVVGLGIIISILRRRPGATADDLAELKG